MATKVSPNAEVVRINDEDFTLRLTLGGLSLIEDTFEVKNLGELQEILKEPSAKDIEKIAVIMIRCGGEQVPDNFFMTADVELGELLPAILRVFTKSFKMKGAPTGNGERPPEKEALTTSPGTTGTDTPASS